MALSTGVRPDLAHDCGTALWLKTRKETELGVFKFLQAVRFAILTIVFADIDVLTRSQP
jgi:hypothetical protein